MPIPTITAAALLGLLGVNTHLSWADTPAWAPAAWPIIERDLRYIGAARVRDDPPWPGTTLPEYQRLCRLGLQFDLAPGTRFASAIPGGIDALARANPGCIAAIEGPNEINDSPDSFDGITAKAAPARFGRAVQGALYAQVRADPLLAGQPVYNLTISGQDPFLIASLGDMAGMADAGNWHAYAGTGAPLDNLVAGLRRAQTLVPGKPAVISEIGYCGGTAGGWCSVDRAHQAAWTLDLWMDAARLGIPAVYIYELADNAPHAGPQDLENAFGLFDSAGNPYPVATALHALHAILDDPGPASSAAIAARVSGDASVLGIARADGTQQVILWDEAGARDVTVTLDAPADVTLRDPLVGTAAVASYAATRSVRVAVTDHPVVLTFRP
jgi:hypothetical protein